MGSVGPWGDGGGVGGGAGEGGGGGGKVSRIPGEDELFYHESDSEIYSRKVFVGGLPIDIGESELMRTFGSFGPVLIDWPHKNHSGGYVPPKGYVFLVFETEAAVRELVKACYSEQGKHYLLITSPLMKDKPVQVRPWRLADSDFVVEESMELNTRRTVFLGGVPRPLKAVALAKIMDKLFGNVCYAGIDSDPELKYPKGAGRVSFATNASYIAAIAAKFVHLQHGDVDKRVEVKPYVLDDSHCDECGGTKSGGRFAPYFCADVSCLQYYCQACWSHIHAFPRRSGHSPFQKDAAKESRRFGLHRISIPPHMPHSARLAAQHFALNQHSSSSNPNNANPNQNNQRYHLPTFPFPK